MSDNKGYQVWLPLLLSLFTVAGMLIGYNLKAPPTVVRINGDEDVLPDRSPYGAGKVEEILRYVESKYVDEVDREELIDRAIDQLLEELDPHSKYISAEELLAVNENLQGNFVGIGIEFDILRDTILVLSVIEGGPSDELGILPGDRIVEVNDSIVAGVNIDNKGVTSKLRGEEGTVVKIGIKRNNNDFVIPYEIERGTIPLNSVDVSLMLDSKTGYIKINRFSDTTYEEFMNHLDELIADGMEDLVLDLRQNPGGYLKEATRILNQVIADRNEMLVYTEGEHSLRKEYKTKGIVKHKIDDVAVLMDEGSASASEILAGALQDTDRGLVIGRRSFGKGLVQEQYDLSDGAALRLTVARYYTKSGRLIQKSYGDGTDYDGDTNDRYENGELDAMENIELSDSTEFFTTNGRVVYGGGGIIPDIFVPMDDIFKNDDYVVASNYVAEFVYGILDKERPKLLEKDIHTFLREYEISDVTFDKFLNHCTKNDADLDRKNLESVRDDLKNRIKASIARNVYGLEGYFSVRNQTDDMVLKSLEILDESKSWLETD